VKNRKVVSGILFVLYTGIPWEFLPQAIATMMGAHWRSVVRPDRLEGIGAFNEGQGAELSGSGH
jgi:transposase